MIGVTGTGKSATANSICGEAKFVESAGSGSETDEVSCVLTRWQALKNEDPVIVIDTPGLDDSEDRDTAHIATLVGGLKEVGYVNTFVIVLNSEAPRLSLQLKKTIKLFS